MWINVLFSTTLLLTAAAHPTNVTSSSASPGYSARNACPLLLEDLGKSKVQFEADPLYENQREVNWSESCQLFPTCIVTPLSADDVSTIVKRLQQTRTSFAIRSGGHNANPGFANINNGVLLNLGNLTELSLPGNRPGVASIGVGNRLQAAYEFLELKHLTFVGGRWPTVGVGGLVLGGGLSYLSSQYGFACDQVVNYEVVLADSSIVNANEHENKDLFRALKGGSANFGIVTRVDVIAKPSPKFWLRTASFGVDKCVQLYKRQASVQKGVLEKNSNTTLAILGNPTGCTLNQLVDSSTVQQQIILEAFADFIPDSEVVVANLTHSALVALVGAIPFAGTRHLFSTASSLPNAEVNSRAYEFIIAGQKQLDGIATLQYYPQPITSSMIRPGQATNSLGLHPVAQTWHQVGANWNSSTDDALVHSIMANITASIKKEAFDLGASLDFLFMNDAAADQPVLESYGTKNIEFLRSVSRKYDPEQMFQELQNDGFLVSQHQ